MPITKRKPVCWILKCQETGLFLCTDNRLRAWCPVEKFKTYKTAGRAMKRAGTRYECIAMYEGDTIDCYGQIKRAER